MHIDGQCHCGFVTYEAEIDPATVSICHCTDCQQLTGSALRVTAFAEKGDLHLTSNPPRLYTRLGDNGRRRLQYFCPQCGSPLLTTGEGEDSQVWGIRVGTINQRAQLAPSSRIWCSSALPWLNDIADIPGRDRD